MGLKVSRGTKRKDVPARPGLGSRKARLRRNADGGPNFLLWGGLALGGYLAYRWLTDKSDKAPALPAAPAFKAPASPALPAFPEVPPAQTLAPALPAAPSNEDDWRVSATVEELDSYAKLADPTKAASGIGNYYNEA